MAKKKMIKKGPCPTCGHHPNSKVGIVMEEFKEGKLHSGSKKGPRVKNPKQAIAIALSMGRKAGEVKGKRKNKRSDESNAWTSVR